MESLKDKRIWVTGHTGLVGDAVTLRLTEEDCSVITVPRNQLDLRNFSAVDSWVRANRIDIVIHTAAVVNGIMDNINRPADFITDNLRIDTAVIHACREMQIVYLGSACAYPRHTDQVGFRETDFLNGPPEPTNESYAMSKLAGMELMAAHGRQYNTDGFIVVPCNVYGRGDRSTHVIPTLFKRFMAAKKNKAKRVDIWGTGNPVREFVYSDDLADAIVHLLKTDHGYPVVNVGSGEHVSIMALATKIAEVVGYEGEIGTDPTKPDGIPHKALDLQRITNTGWKPETELFLGLREYHLSLT